MPARKYILTSIAISLALSILGCKLFGGGTPVSGLGDGTQPAQVVEAQPPAVQMVELRQWASSAEASSEYGDEDRSAKQATGKPNTLECGDNATAWASYYKEREEWITLFFDTPVIPTEINIHQSFNPNQVKLVDLIAEPGGRLEIYQGVAGLIDECPYVLSIPVSADYQTREVRIWVDQTAFNKWNEIDAVELVGMAPGEAQAVQPMITSEPGGSSSSEGGQPQPPSPAVAFNPTGWSWKSFKKADGLPDDIINAIAIARDGAIWFAGGNGGVTRFDGAEWTTFGQDSPFGISGARDIAETSDGVLWFATSWGVRSYDGKEWKIYTTDEGLVNNDVQDLAVAPDGALWVAGNHGVSRFDGKSWKNYTVADGLVDSPHTSIAVGIDGVVWLGTQAGVNALQDGKWNTYTTVDGLAENFIQDVATGLDGSVWFGTFSLGATRYDGKLWINYRSDDGLYAYSVPSVTPVSDGSVWFGSGGYGAFRFDGRESWQRFTQSDGLGGDWINTITVAPEGTVWFALKGAGVTRFGP